MVGMHKIDIACCTSLELRQMLWRYRIQQSMSRLGNCWTTRWSVFFRSLKTKWISEQGCSSQGQAEADVLCYLTDYYNQRPYSYNGYRTPAKTESLAG